MPDRLFLQERWLERLRSGLEPHRTGFEQWLDGPKAPALQSGKKSVLCTSFPYHPKIAQIATARGCLTSLDARGLPKTSPRFPWRTPATDLTVGVFSRVSQVTKGARKGSYLERN